MPNHDEMMRHIIEMKEDIAIIKTNTAELPARVRSLEDSHTHMQGQISGVRIVASFAAIIGSALGWVASHLWGMTR
jgi:hypothetical protein